jgi:transposase
MLYIKKLSEEIKLILKDIYKNHPNNAPRIRAKAVLLSNDGYSLKELSEILGICRQTAAIWLHSWEDEGVNSLFDNPRSGRPSKLSEENKKEAIELIKKSPRSLKKVLAELAEKLNITLSSSTLKTLCKQAKYCWKRVRKSLRNKRNPEWFAQSKQQLEALIILSKQQDIDLYYFDQSGFTLEPCVPYAWQPIGENLELPCSKSPRLNVLGFLNRDCSFQSWVFEDTITSSVVIACINEFSKSIKRPTVLVIDNAPIHTSNEFVDMIEEWKKLGLTILYIAPYSPELNIIEILWKKIKYEWMPFSAYQSFNALKQNLFDILANIGRAYSINFT